MICNCGHDENMHHGGAFCMAEVIGADFDKTVDACPCGKYEQMSETRRKLLTYAMLGKIAQDQAAPRRSAGASEDGS